MKRIMSLVLGLGLLGGAWGKGAEPDGKSGPSEVYAAFAFTPATAKDWKLPAGIAGIETVDGASALRIRVSPDRARGQHVAVREIDLVPLRGRQVELRYQVRAVDVTKPPDAWNGVKLMLHYKTDFAEVWRSPRDTYGSFEWKTISQWLMIPFNATRGRLMLGLQDSAGTLYVRNMEIRVGPAQAAMPLPEGGKAQYTERVRAMPTLRGAMSPNAYQPEDMEALAAWGANLIRWQLKRTWGAVNDGRDIEEYRSWLDKRLDELDRVMDKCQALGIKVVIDMHTPPGGRYANGDMAIFHEPAYAGEFYALWEKIAKRYQKHPALWAYNLVNEPAQAFASATGYLSVQYEAAQRIRAIDAETPIMLESNNWSDPQTFPEMRPLPLANIIYQAHMYAPMNYTHQGVDPRWKEPGGELFVQYPGNFNGKKTDRAWLRNYLKPVRDFQEKYGARIYLGEFSAARWAPGAARYLDDVLSICEEYGWDWSYHAFRESPIWSVEHTADYWNTERATEETDRGEVLRKYFRRNAKTPPN